MTDNIATVSQQVAVLFILIGVGVLCAKIRLSDGKTLLGEEAVGSLVNIILYITTPCVIIHSFIRNYDPAMLRGLGTVGLVSLALHGGSILIALLAFHNRDMSRRRVMQFVTVFSNAGYMAIPLQQAIIGDEGVFYGAVYIAVFNIALWTYGLFIMSGDKNLLSIKKLLVNPALIALVVGLPIFFLSIPIPAIIAAPIRHIAALNTPIPMIVIGYYLAGAYLRRLIRLRSGYLAIALRLLDIPLAALGCLRLAGVYGNVGVSCMVAISAPVAAATTMFSAKFGRDTALSVNLVSLSTLLSILTMPLIVALAQYLLA